VLYLFWKWVRISYELRIDHPVFADAPSTVLTRYPHQKGGQSLHDFWNFFDDYLKLPPPEVPHFDISEMPCCQIDNAAEVSVTQRMYLLHG
jgi:hypothetical protein